MICSLKRVLLAVVLLATVTCWASTDLAPTATVYARMRDGTELPTDLFYPSNAAICNDYPCILIRVPAGRKAPPWCSLGNMAQGNYVVAIQDTRSSIDTQGKTLPCLDDRLDGYDAVEWLAASSFTNGKVGSLGCSAAGITQLMMATTAPPSLHCQYIGQAAASLYHDAIYPGGQFSKNLVESWLGLYAPDSSVLDAVKSQPIYNDFWAKGNTLELAHEVDVPAIHYGGWYDPFLQGTIDSFVSRQTRGKEGAKGEQKLLIGPWNHYWPLDLTLGEYDIPAHAKLPPLEISPMSWFDFHLKDQPNGIKDIHTVTYYVMGPFDGTESSGNAWRHADSWPVPATMTPMYLTADRRLSRDMAQYKKFVFDSDPQKPVPTLGGRNLFLPSGPMDQRLLEERGDVIVFTTEPFAEDTEVTGNIVANLYITSTAEDTDIAVRLTDVYPDGKSLLVLDGIARTGVAFHNQPKTHIDEPTLVPVDLQTTSIVFAKGHRLRISVAGSNYPRFEVSQNLDAQGKPSVAKTTVFTGKEMPSHILLPIVKK